MKRHKRFTVAVRRKREGKTNYRKRLKTLIGGKPRLVVRRSSKNIFGQIIEYTDKGDKVLVSASSKQVEKLGWKYGRGSLPCAYLTGFLIAKRADKKIKEAVFDIGMNPPIRASRVFAFLKGAFEGGLEVKHSEEILPSDERVRGKHIADYANKLKAEDQAKYEKQFSKYLKNKVEPENIEKEFENIKKKIEDIK